MGNSPFADTLIQILLGWLKWLTDIVWSLLRDGGETGIGLFQWFSKNWITVFIFMLLVGLAVDWIIWMIRWRPYWIWFRKKRPVAADKPMRRTVPAMAMQQRVQPPRFVSALKNEESFFAEMEDMSESAQLFDEPAMPVRKTYAGNAKTKAENHANYERQSVPHRITEMKNYEASVVEDAYNAKKFVRNETYDSQEEYVYDAEEFASKEMHDVTAEQEKYRRYMRPETEVDNRNMRVTEDAQPLSRRERRKFFEGDNEEDDE